MNRAPRSLYFGPDDDGLDWPLVVWTGLALLIAAVVLGSAVVAWRLSTWSDQALDASDCRTAETLAALADRRAVDLAVCPGSDDALVLPDLSSLLFGGDSAD
jgi:hypothetical protein